ncbi:ribosomal protein S5 domain 2-type protein [Hyaloraphidium curvatum]|nr:ribosomal protein S5 domain 2-type protein [Hyaloraphidium curvatum]
MHRFDGRSDGQIREMAAEIGPLPSSDGSARFSFGETSVVCAFYGPKEARLRDELYDEAVVELSLTRPKEGTGPRYREDEISIKEIALSSMLSEMHQGAAFKMAMNVASDHGSSFSAAINAASLALLDSCVPTRNLCVSATCAVAASGALMLDPTDVEAEAAASLHSFVFHGPDNVGLVASRSTGTFTEDEFNAGLDLCRAAAAKIHAFMSLSIRNAVERERDGS